MAEREAENQGRKYKTIIGILPAAEIWTNTGRSKLTFGASQVSHALQSDFDPRHNPGGQASGAKAPREAALGVFKFPGFLITGILQTERSIAFPADGRCREGLDYGKTDF
jgi:hypothetical protein